MVRFAAVFALLAAACGEPLGPGSEGGTGGTGAGGSGGHQGVNTGNGLTISVSNIIYSADAPLSSTETEVIVVGSAEAVDPPEAALTVTNERTSSSVEPTVGADGSFLFVISAQLDDVLGLRLALDEESETEDLLLAEELFGFTPPQGTSVPFILGPDASGMLTVSLVALVDPPPFVVFNRDSGAFLEVETQSMTSVLLPGASGDTVCVFSTGRLMTTTSYCQDAP